VATVPALTIECEPILTSHMITATVAIDAPFGGDADPVHLGFAACRRLSGEERDR